MNFFCTKKHYDQWVAQHRLDAADFFCLDAEEALSVAEMIFSNPAR